LCLIAKGVTHTKRGKEVGDNGRLFCGVQNTGQLSATHAPNPKRNKGVRARAHTPDPAGELHPRRG